MQVSAVILTGGRSRRFGGTHKPGVDLDGRVVISRILTAVRDAEPSAGVWVAGPLDGLTEAEAAGVEAVREEPRFSGPLAGIAAAAHAIETVAANALESVHVGSSAGPGADDITLLIAGDMPLVTPAHLRDLIRAGRDAGVPAVGFDDRGSMQFLCAAWPTRLLLERLAEIGDPADKAVKLLYRDLDTVRVDVDPDQLLDFDTPEEFHRVRTRLEESAAGADNNAGAAGAERAESAAGTDNTAGAAGTDNAAARSDRSAAHRGRPVPEAVLNLREQAAQSTATPTEWGEISEADAAAVLDFASRIKHSDAELSPVLAAFLAGSAYARQEAGESVAEALARVEQALKPKG